MTLGEWLTIASLAVSLIALGVGIWGHTRINQIKNIYNMTTSGEHSPTVETNSGGQVVNIINSIGGNMYQINPPSSSPQPPNQLIP